MTRFITLLVLFVAAAVTAQTNYDADMTKAFSDWEKGNQDEALAIFEYVEKNESDNWLPGYYVSFINTLKALEEKDSKKVNELLAKAQLSQDRAMEISPDNPELLVSQSLIYTAYIVNDPMANGMKFSGIINELYAKALAVGPKNPRVVLSKAEFEIGTAKYMGGDIKPICAEVKNAVDLFKNYKPESKFHPNWGSDRALRLLEECKEK